MGLDSYLYKTGSRHRPMMERAATANSAYNAFSDALLHTDRFQPLKDLPTDLRGRLLNDLLTDSQKDLIREYKDALADKAKELGGVIDDLMLFTLVVQEEDRDPVMEIGYWRKNWDLHNFIVEHYGDPEDDNCREIYLDADALQTLASEFGCKEFEKALKVVNGGGVVFYYAWY